MRPLDPKNESDLHDIERLVHAEDTLIARMAQSLVVEVRRLRHELADPNYIYAHGRIARAAIVCRNNEIDSLREQLKSKNENPGN